MTRRSPNVWKAAHPRYPDRKALIACTEVLTFRYEFPITALDFVTAARARIRSRIDWLAQMVPQVDVLVSAAPHTHLSEGMFNEAIFHAMKRPTR